MNIYIYIYICAWMCVDMAIAGNGWAHATIYGYIRIRRSDYVCVCMPPYVGMRIHTDMRPFIVRLGGWAGGWTGGLAGGRVGGRVGCPAQRERGYWVFQWLSLQDVLGWDRRSRGRACVRENRRFAFLGGGRLGGGGGGRVGGRVAGCARACVRAYPR